jgi:nitrate reductase gamma subunit
MTHYLFQVAFVWYPYVVFTVFLLGSLIRFERDPYTWRASSSQILRKRQLFWGSNLFHVGILFLLFGHTVGLLTPTEIYTLVITVPQKKMMAVISGGIAGVLCFVGLTMLLHRRLFDVRIRRTSSVMDIAILAILWVQLTLGLVTLPLSVHHSDGGVMLALSHWAQGIVILDPVDVTTLEALPWPYLAHLVLGMTVFLIFPFSRLVHIWSVPVWYLGRRGYQVVRTRRPMPARQPPVRQPAE